MKKIFSSVIATMLAASVFFAGCSGVQTENGETSTTAYTGSYGKYAQIGTDVYAALNEAFGSSENARAVLEGAEAIEDASSETCATLAELQEKGYVSEVAASYIERMETAIDNGENLSDILAAISAIEEEALANLSGDDLDAVMTYAESAKAIFNYFDTTTYINDEDCEVRAAQNESVKKEKESKKSFRERCGELWDKVKEPVKAACRGAIKGGAVAADRGANRNEIIDASVKGAIGGACGGIVVEIAKELHKRSAERYKDRDWRNKDHDKGHDK